MLSVGQLSVPPQVAQTLAPQKHQQPKVMKLAIDFIDAFSSQFKMEKTLHRQESNAEIIPSSAKIEFTFHYVAGVKGGPESKSLDIEASAVRDKCRKMLKEQVLKAMRLNLT